MPTRSGRSARGRRWGRCSRPARAPALPGGVCATRGVRFGDCVWPGCARGRFPNLPETAESSVIRLPAPHPASSGLGEDPGGAGNFLRCLRPSRRPRGPAGGFGDCPAQEPPDRRASSSPSAASSTGVSPLQEG